MLTARAQHMVSPTLVYHIESYPECQP